ncbi:MAG: hypothetical protein KDK66_09725 [Deltaproteobacteria bacterium]|nr:hypothetical protein [Deltaproteobacteria bacterium]
MKSSFLTALVLLLISTPVLGGGTSVKLGSTGEGKYTKGPTDSSNDPYKNKKVKKSDLEGHESTHRDYSEDCADAQCQATYDRWDGKTKEEKNTKKEKKEKKEKKQSKSSQKQDSSEAKEEEKTSENKSDSADSENKEGEELQW